MTPARTVQPAKTMTYWDRAAIAVLALAGFTLSYDALRQTAEAIHVRHVLTYVFPLIIDGFIAYGIRALLVLRTAPFSARAYAWALFLASTTASVWANTLHAVRLNEQTSAGSGLRLGDTAVGALSMIAPLALAGAVHLGILIARHAADGDPDTPNRPASKAGQPGGPDGVPTQITPKNADRISQPTATAKTRTDREPTARRRRTGRPPGATMEQLLAAARPAVEKHGLTVAVVKDAVRAADLPVGSARFTQLMKRLRTEQDQSLSQRGRAHPGVD
ncbi:DUF2637 domain-containing protein [Streptomyces sp. NPDC087422]|uniref:DUF2637 domain-containing protein n=1 Tax=Streptomyces sp. NPDC087422 TaxID=3365786 RepID=UPI0037FCBF1B